MMKMIERKLKGQKKFLELLVASGLRAQLEMQSLVTGQLGIHLDFFPDKPVRLVGAEPDYPEIPTVESSLSELMKTVQICRWRRLPIRFPTPWTELTSWSTRRT